MFHRDQQNAYKLVDKRILVQNQIQRFLDANIYGHGLSKFRSVWTGL